MRTIKKTNKNEQWTSEAKRVFKNNIEALMVFLAQRSIIIKEDRWDKSQRRVISNDVNAAFGQIWPELYGDEKHE
tara:strand:- start:176 stop:400 length:225 start_codon:yes stop_codon:yes gene_type:complete